MTLRMALLCMGFCVSPSYGGDYLVQIANDPTAVCGKTGKPPLPHWPVRTGAEVAADITRYFRGENDSPALLARFANGHFIFCGREERGEVNAALIAVARNHSVQKEKELYGLLRYLGSSLFVSQAEEALEAPGLSPTTRKRLERMKREAEEAVCRATRRCSSQSAGDSEVGTLR